MHKESNKPVETIVDLLAKHNIKDVERATGIPADRMYKWIKGKGAPKSVDMVKLIEYLKMDLSSAEKGEEFEMPDVSEYTFTVGMYKKMELVLEKSIEFQELSIKHKDKLISVLESQIEELKETIVYLRDRLKKYES